MNVIGSIVLGLIAGFIASRLMNKRGEGMFRDIVLGIVGALVGGWLFNAMGTAGVTGFNIRSLFVAVIGAVVSLVLWHALRGSSLRANDRSRRCMSAQPRPVCLVVDRRPLHVPFFVNILQLIFDCKSHFDHHSKFKKLN